MNNRIFRSPMRDLYFGGNDSGGDTTPKPNNKDNDRSVVFTSISWRDISFKGIVELILILIVVSLMVSAPISIGKSLYKDYQINKYEENIIDTNYYVSDGIKNVDNPFQKQEKDTIYVLNHKEGYVQFYFVNHDSIIFNPSSMSVDLMEYKKYYLVKLK
jgi:hypothetical protein